MTSRKIVALAVSAAFIVFIASRLVPGPAPLVAQIPEDRSAVPQMGSPSETNSAPVIFRPAAGLQSRFDPSDLAGWVARQKQKPGFHEFASWLEDFAADGVADIERGAALAKERRERLAELIQSDPERAIELAMPPDVIAALPPAVAAFAEDHVNGRGRLAVLGAVPEAGHKGEFVSTFRTAT